MKKTYKRIFGFLGLVFVAAMTVFAAALPGPEALAASSSVTDTIVVTVISASPDVNIIKPSSGMAYAHPNQTVDFNFSNVNQVTATLQYTDKNGNVTNTTLYDNNANLVPGSETISIDMASYGYGEFELKVSGVGQTGLPEVDTVRFSFVPVTATVDEDDATGDVVTTLNYDDTSPDIDHFIINVYDENGNLVPELSSIPVSKSDGKKVKLPFTQNTPAGKYTISVTTYDASNNVVYKPYNVDFNYNPLPVPNTGGLFVGMNISRADYLITGIGIFLATGIGGIILLNKDKKSKRRN